ncbi:hypothetical protein [Nonomuraea sp. GTA35]|uniref:hypothetical protein n=1 Tax=Nonomuraea sp. GTA35 TaxID=1676746 RepID=UPI0035C19445
MRGLNGKRIVVAGGAEATAQRITAAGGTAVAAAFPLPDGAGWVNGQTWSIDGGGSLHD